MRKRKNEVTFDRLLDMFFDKKEPPCKKGDKFVMDGLKFVCTEASSNTFEYMPLGGDKDDRVTLGRF